MHRKGTREAYRVVCRLRRTPRGGCLGGAKGEETEETRHHAPTLLRARTFQREGELLLTVGVSRRRAAASATRSSVAVSAMRMCLVAAMP